jgi:hypothetical protein
MSERLFLSAPDCEIVCWEDGCVVFDAAEGRTHELSPDAGRVALILCKAREPLSADSVRKLLAAVIPNEPASAAISAEGVDLILEELARIGLATPQRA